MKNILVTGSTSGIGRYVAEELLKKGNFVVITARDTSQTQKELEKYKKQTLFVNADLGTKQGIEKLFNTIAQKLDFIDVLVNNAAMDVKSSLQEYDYDDFKRVLEVNLVAKAFCIQKAVPFLKKSNYPCVVNIASRLADRPRVNGCAYSAAAAGIVMLTQSAAIDLEKDNIRVNCVSPSVTLTPLAERTFDKQVIDGFAKMSTRGRLCEKQDVLNAIEFLSSKKSDFINGENFRLSGGMHYKW